MGHARTTEVDRLACPWLVRRFIDPGAAFFYTPAHLVRSESQALRAEPYESPTLRSRIEAPAVASTRSSTSSIYTMPCWIRLPISFAPPIPACSRNRARRQVCSRSHWDYQQISRMTFCCWNRRCRYTMPSTHGARRHATKRTHGHKRRGERTIGSTLDLSLGASRKVSAASVRRSFVWKSDRFSFDCCQS